MNGFPAEWTVRQARDAYLAENGFSVAAYDDKWTSASFLGIKMKVPNTAFHRWAIMLHDLHHVATNYGTDLVGEGEISWWELRGLWSLGPYVGGIVTMGASMGALFSPKRALAAWRTAAAHRSLHDLYPVIDEAKYEHLLDLKVSDLRAMLGVAYDGVPQVAPRKLHDYAPATSVGNAQSFEQDRA